MRLTIKGTGLIDCGGTVADLGKEEYSRRYHEKAASAHIKLGELEDIEDEIGVDLPTLSKAFKNGIWSKGGFHIGGCLENESHFIEPIFLELGAVSGAMCLYTHICGKVIYAVRVEDYGKTWGLIKEGELGERAFDVKDEEDGHLEKE